MTKQNFISMSLESGLKVQFEYNGKNVIDEITGFRDIKSGILDSKEYSHYLFEVKPILHPLFDLAKEIEHGGEKLIVQNEIDKIRKGVLVYKPINDTLPIELEFDTDDYSQTIDLYDGFLIMQILIKYHFDVLGLIDSGRAIDINTLETNPYK